MIKDALPYIVDQVIHIIMDEKDGKVTKGDITKIIKDVLSNTVLNIEHSSELCDPEGYENDIIGYWKDKVGFHGTELKCSNIYCKNGRPEATHGAHVRRISEEVSRTKKIGIYFVPFCARCNNYNNDEAKIVDRELVPAPPECYKKKTNKENK